jgi:SAM-dependent methyltransferase
VNDALRPGISVLDVGAGRRPTISPAQRPAGAHYVGLDISADELEAAAPDSYDETVVAEAEMVVSSLVDRFDLIVARHVLEHFRDIQRAAEAFHQYARPGGLFVADLSGRYAAFAVANRILPGSLARHLVARLQRRPLESVFPAHYDRCHERGLRSAFSGWDELHVIPLWRGADYLDRLPKLRSLYVRYEDWAIKRDLSNLATHYVVAARKAENPA